MYSIYDYHISYLFDIYKPTVGFHCLYLLLHLENSIYCVTVQMWLKINLLVPT